MSFDDYLENVIKNMDKGQVNIDMKVNNKSYNHENFNFDKWPAHAIEDRVDWVEWRRLKKQPITQRVVNMMGKQLAQAIGLGYSVSDSIDTQQSRGWVGFEANWLESKQSTHSVNAISNKSAKVLNFVENLPEVK